MTIYFQWARRLVIGIGIFLQLSLFNRCIAGKWPVCRKTSINDEFLHLISDVMTLLSVDYCVIVRMYLSGC